jgi:hypothetical protein
VVDISPAVGKVSPEFQAYINAMHQIQDAKLQSRKEADDLLQETEPVRFTLARSLSWKSSPSENQALCIIDGGAVSGASVYKRKSWNEEKILTHEITGSTQDLSVRQFLLTNLDRASPSDPYHFRIPLPFLQNAIDEIGAFPYTPGERVYEKPSLFLKGEPLLLLGWAFFVALREEKRWPMERWGCGNDIKAARASTSTRATSPSSSNSSPTRGSKPSTQVIGVRRRWPSSNFFHLFWCCFRSLAQENIPIGADHWPPMTCSTPSLT